MINSKQNVYIFDASNLKSGTVTINSDEKELASFDINSNNLSSAQIITTIPDYKTNEKYSIYLNSELIKDATLTSAVTNDSTSTGMQGGGFGKGNKQDSDFSENSAEKNIN